MSQTATKSRKPLLIGLSVLALAAAFGGRLWWQAQHFIDTDNAFVAGHVHPVSARIAGVVTQVQVEDNAAVQPGQALLVLDPSDQRLAIDKLKAQLTQVQAQAVAARAQVAQAHAQVGASQAQVSQSQALLGRAQQDAQRADEQFNGALRVITKQTLDGALSARDAQSADLAARRAALSATQQQVDSAKAAQAAAEAQAQVLQVQIKDAEQQLAYTTLQAPAAGRVGKRTVEVGQRVQPGQQLLAVVQDEVWITANFKETQLAKMKPAQRAEVHIDAFPGRVFHARVQSFSPASGAQFALLPPDNATGNFTRVVQRVPVKLVFDEKDIADLKDRIVPGLSAQVSVDLRGEAAAPARVAAR